MGLILDSTALIRAERKGLNARQALAQIMEKVGSTEVGISVITALEFAMELLAPIPRSGKPSGRDFSRSC
jgi:predicted nucleic acid-binding protein